MRSLTTDRNLIVSAIERSSLLQVSVSQSDQAHRMTLILSSSLLTETWCVESSPCIHSFRRRGHRKNCLRGEYKSSQLLLSITIPSQESLPPQSTHDQLQRLFKQFGTIVYVRSTLTAKYTIPCCTNTMCILCNLHCTVSHDTNPVETSRVLHLLSSRHLKRLTALLR